MVYLVMPKTHASNTPSLQLGTLHMTNQLKLGVQDLDPVVTGVQDVDLVVQVYGEAAGLDQTMVTGAMATVAQEWSIVTRHIEEEWTAFDRTSKYEHFEAVGSNRWRCEANIIGSVVKI